MGALFKYNNMPVCDLRVTLSPAWSLSTKQLTSTLFCRGRGGLGGRFSTGGRSSTAYRYISFIGFIRAWLNLDLQHYDIPGQNQARSFFFGQGI